MVCRMNNNVMFTYATISVVYPAGSTCTCSNGSKTITAKNTSGVYSFKVPWAGTWTIYSTNGSKSASTSVSITYKKQTASVTLVYRTYLYNYGDECSGVAGTWSTWYGSKQATYLKCEAEADHHLAGISMSDSVVSLASYSTLYIVYKAYHNGGLWWLGNTSIYVKNGSTTIYSGSPNDGGSLITLPVSVSSYSGPVSIGFNADIDITYEVYQVWLE